MRTRILRYVVDGRSWEEPAGARTAVEEQHRIATEISAKSAKSVRVIERYANRGEK